MESETHQTDDSSSTAKENNDASCQDNSEMEDGDGGQSDEHMDTETHNETAEQRQTFISKVVDHFSWLVKRTRTSEDAAAQQREEDGRQQASPQPASKPKLPTLTGVEKATQTQDDHLGNPNRILVAFEELICKVMKRKQISQGAVETVEIACQTDEESCPEMEDGAAVFNLQFTSNCVNLSSSPLYNVQAIDEVLTRHQQPGVVKTLVINDKVSLNKIPESVGMFGNLVVLNLRNNALTQLPWTVAVLQQLEMLDLSYNLFRSLPRVVTSIASLRHLNLEANHLKFLPTELLKLTTLKTINVTRNNGLKSPSLAVCAKGVEALFTELKNRPGRRNLWQVHPSGQFDREVKSLQDLCIETVVAHKVDFLAGANVPPTVKRCLANIVEDDAVTIKVAKCSSCRKYYSCKETFDNHCCSRK